MRKHIISKWLLMAVATVVTACSSDKDELFLPQEAPVPVLFTATDDDATTRVNEERMTSPQMVAQAGGFGVFTYYSNGNGATDGAYGSPATTANFMHNQLVTGTNAVDPVWTYTPLKYWPNETGATAKSNHVDKLSFFAYAPYIAAGTTYNITGVSPANFVGDPWVTYNSPSNLPGYDLVYAKAVNQVKPTLTDKVTLDFAHALAALSFEIVDDAGLDLQKLEVFGWKGGIQTAGKLNLYTGDWSEITTKTDKTEVVFVKEEDPLPATGGNWKVIPGDDQEFFVRITFKDANGDMKVIPEMPFKEDFEAGKNKIIQLTIP